MRRRGADLLSRATLPAHADALVIGAGPGGIATVGHLLARRSSVLWVDGDGFSGGALARYRKVPANTKVDILASLGTGDFLPQFDVALSTGTSAVLKRMHDTATQLHLDHDPATIGWTGLDVCHDFYISLTEAMLGAEAPFGRTDDGQLQALRGRVDALRRDRSSALWHARLHGASSGAGFEMTASSVVIATGATSLPAPTAVQPSAWACERRPRVLPVAAALQDDRLRALVQPHETVGIVGGGHTGIVLAHMLTERLGVSTRLFIRRPLQLAQWSAHDGGYSAWAFRGLKGAAAGFAQRRGLVGISPPNGPIAVVPGPVPPTSGALELHDSRTLTTDPRAGAALDAVVYCLGFGAPPLPALIGASGETLPPPAAHTQPGGALLDADGRRLPGLYGCGLAFSDSEFTSGAAYAEAGFMPFACRAAEVAEQIVSDVCARPARSVKKR
jgi:hypothetical protein